MLSEVKQYIAEMGITDNFYQQMMNTEPSQMAIYGPVHPTTSDGAALPTSDAKALGLRWDSYRKLVPEYDPVYQEVEISYDARFHGVTTSEMRQRQNDAEQCYKRWEFASKDYSNCWMAAAGNEIQ